MSERFGNNGGPPKMPSVRQWAREEEERKEERTTERDLLNPDPYYATSDCLDINYIVISNSLRQRGDAEDAEAVTASYTTWHRFKHRLLKYPNALHFFD
ncbi:hypothetical protein EYF80_046810 [Liparis tanakae]|uniref:Uncharacterized protein n=1 Tax=Liparis tanakae TaxID=230148 RepID=A0A4Z2FPC7_9TELE|nr:hypothetical protein EYF80_046810 [Liparis tanakae]